MSVRIMVELEIDGDGADEHALNVVDNVLDSGVFQDAINEWEHDGEPLEVTSAVVVLPSQEGQLDPSRIVILPEGRRHPSPPPRPHAQDADCIADGTLNADGDCILRPASSGRKSGCGASAFGCDICGGKRFHAKDCPDNDDAAPPEATSWFTFVGFYKDDEDTYIGHEQADTAEEVLKLVPEGVRVVAVFAGRLMQAVDLPEVLPADGSRC